MGKLAAAAAVTGVGGTGGAALVAHSMGVFGGGSGEGKGAGISDVPTLRSQLVEKGYTYSPLKVSKEETVPQDGKFTWNNGDCISKLFPGLASKIKGTEISSSQATASTITVSVEDSANKTVYFDKPKKVTNELVSCALLDLREGGTGSTIDKKYFKSEVVVRDKEHGWIM